MARMPSSLSALAPVQSALMRTTRSAVRDGRRVADRVVPGSAVPGCDTAPFAPTAQVTGARTLEAMTREQHSGRGIEMGGFLRARRAGVTPAEAGLRPNPAHVVSRTKDLLAANPGGLRLLTGIEEWPVRQRNIARYVFLHPAARELFHDWNSQIRGCVARLRALAGTDPDAPDRAQLAGELLLKSPEFTRLWERYDVKGSTHGRKTFHHPEAGDLTLGYQLMELDGTPAIA